MVQAIHNLPPRGRNRRFRFSLRTIFILMFLCACCFAVAVPTTRMAREAAGREECSNNLKGIAVALFNYREAYGCFPPPVFTDAKGVAFAEMITRWRREIDGVMASSCSALRAREGVRHVRFVAYRTSCPTG